MGKIYLRALKEEDAAISFRWRNDYKVWRHTKNKPDRKVTWSVEREWIKNVLKRNDEKRFAICESASGRYIGNVQLTNINKYDAELHIFIGERECWGKGYGSEATRLIVEYGFFDLELQSIYLDVKKENTPAIKAYQKSRFSQAFEYDDYIRMVTFKDVTKKKVSVFVMTYNHEKFIGQALDGILCQKVNFNYEIVVGDDFSRDSTRQILLKYADSYPGKFKLLFYPKNITAPVNQDWVFKNCSGQYVAMCEGDDYWSDPNKLQRQVDFLEANKDYVLCFHSIKMINASGELVDDNRQPIGNKRDFEKFELLKYYLPTPTIVFEKKIDKLPGYFLSSDNGDALLLALLTHFGRAKYLPEIREAFVRIHAGGTWSSRPHLSKWSSNLKAKILIFLSLDKIRREYVFDHYIQMYEMAAWEADYYKSKLHWFKYNFRYLQFCLLSHSYGKAWLIFRRILNKPFIK